MLFKMPTIETLPDDMEEAKPTESLQSDEETAAADAALGAGDPLIPSVQSPVKAPVDAIPSTEMALLDDDDDEEDEEDEEEIEDESMIERVVALTEMFPGCVRKSSTWLTSSIISSSQWCYGKSRTVLWAAATSAIILYLPVVLENERASLEEAQMQQQRQMLLGPNAAMGGAAGQGLMPGGMPQITPGR